MCSLRSDGHVHADATREPHELRCDPTCGLQEGCGGLGALAKETLGYDPMKCGGGLCKARRSGEDRCLGWHRSCDVLEAARQQRLQLASHRGRRDADERRAVVGASGRHGLDAHARASNPAAEIACVKI